MAKEYRLQDGEEPVGVRWTSEDGDKAEAVKYLDPSADCDGVMIGQALFVPADGQGGPDTAIIEDDGAYYVYDNDEWYDLASGKAAIYGLPGSTLAVIA